MIHEPSSNQKVSHLAPLLAFTVLLPSCSTTSNTPSAPVIQLTPLTKTWTPDLDYSNFYTRLLLTIPHAHDDAHDKVTPGAADQNVRIPFGYNDRRPLARLLWGRHSSLNLTAYVSLGTYQATVPLSTIDHTGNRSDGETFIRDFVHSSQNLPLVLLKGDGSNTTATFRFVLKGSDITQSSAATAAIQTAQAIAATLAPEPSVVTTLSSQSTQDKANALDKAINSALTRELDEEQWVDNDVLRRGGGVMVTLFIPSPKHETALGDAANFKQVETWTLRFESPRPSVFADIQMCLTPSSQSSGQSEVAANGDCRNTSHDAIIAAETAALRRPEQVLTFNLLKGSQSLGTVAAYLKQQSWWDESLKIFNSMKDPDEPEPSSARFCRLIKQTILAIGLNAIDAGIIVSAVRDRGPLPPRIVSAMTSVPECRLAVPLPTTAPAIPDANPRARACSWLTRRARFAPPAS